MEVMEEGNLMDRVPVLLQRDMQYYEVIENICTMIITRRCNSMPNRICKQQHQTVLQEMICSGVVGGTLDFPRSASFASVKIVQWYEVVYERASRGCEILYLS